MAGRPALQETKSVLVGEVLSNTLYLPVDERRGRLHARLMLMPLEDIEFLLAVVEQKCKDSEYDPRRK